MLLFLQDLSVILLQATSGTDIGENINEFGQIAISLTAIGVVFAATVRYLVLKPMKSWIVEQTKQIQPNANGGKSLSDVNKKVDAQDVKMDEQTKKINETSETIIVINKRLDIIFNYLINGVVPKKTLGE